LVVAPGQGISYQRHFRRSEYWVVSHGECQIKYATTDSKKYKIIKMIAGDSFEIPALSWHQVYNEHLSPCHIIEVQFGQYSSEEDIERLEYYDAK
jgi:mannose-6-phosphate isomerase